MKTAVFETTKLGKGEGSHTSAAANDKKPDNSHFDNDPQIPVWQAKCTIIRETKVYKAKTMVLTINLG